MKKAYIIGNGTSRNSYDLKRLIGQGTVFGCNALYRDFAPDFLLPDYLVAIDSMMISEIESSDFPEERFILPPPEERWEPIELHWGQSANSNWNPARPRSNAGMNAILEAIKMGHNYIHILGFDFLTVAQDQALSNMYEGTDHYGEDTRATVSDTRNRLAFLGFVIENNPLIQFTFHFPKNYALYKS